MLLKHGYWVLSKGQHDAILHHGEIVCIESLLSIPKRCGGIGDVLAGLASAIIAKAVRSNMLSSDVYVARALTLSSQIVRATSYAVFAASGRGIHAAKVIDGIASEVDKMLGELE